MQHYDYGPFAGDALSSDASFHPPPALGVPPESGPGATPGEAASREAASGEAVPGKAMMPVEGAVPDPLVVRLKAGSAEAFAELVETHSARMYAVARRICPSEADDVLQEAFLSAYRAIEQFDGRSMIATWLHRITVNAALKRRRKLVKRPEVSIEDLLPRFTNGVLNVSVKELPAPVTNAGGLDIEQKRALWGAVDRLPEDYRTVLVMRDLEGMESSVVAAVLGISDALVRQRLHRARLALLKLLNPNDFDSGRTR